MEMKYTTFTEKGIRSYNQDVVEVVAEAGELYPPVVVVNGKCALSVGRPQ